MSQKSQNFLSIKNMLGWMFLVISGYVVMALIYPYSGEYGVFGGVVLLYFFVLLFFVTAFVGSRLAKINFLHAPVNTGWPVYLLWTPFWLSVIGLIFLLIDRYYFQGLNLFTDGPVEVRDKIAEGDVGKISSPFSFVGNILQGAIIISAINSLKLYDNWKLLGIQFLFFLPVIFSCYILGGRTPILMYIVILLSFSIVFLKYDEIIRLANTGFLLVLAGLCFSVLIFMLRADGLTSGEYLLRTLERLGISGAELYDAALPAFLKDIFNYLSAAIAYLVHPFWVASSILEKGSGSGNITFQGLIFLFSKFYSLDFANYKHEYYELFASLPGGLYYDFSLSGLILFPIILGFLFVLSIYLVARYDLKLSYLVVIYCVSTVILAPLNNSLNFPYYVIYMFVIFLYLTVSSFIGISKKEYGT